MEEQITMEVPLALQQLIVTNNERLQEYKNDLMRQVQDANVQMMQILKLDPNQGWRLDANRMVYVKLENNQEN